MTALEDKITELSQMDPESEGYLPAFDEAMKLLHEVPVLYVALSKNSLDRESMKSTPVALGKDGYPAFYVFTAYETAVTWCDHYGFTEDGLPLVASVSKDDNFRSMFQLGNLMGVKMVMVNEGRDYICFGLAEYLVKNEEQTDITMYLSQEEIEQALNGGKVNLALPMLDVIRVN